MTVDKIMADYNLPGIDILKIDIEGAEKEIFQRDNLPWLDKTQTLIIELHDRYKPGCSAALYRSKGIDGFGFQGTLGECAVFSRGGFG